MNLKELREARGLSLRQAAKLIGINRRTLKKLEDGDLGALKPYIRLADFYVLSLDDVVKEVTRGEETNP